jgi:general secretion pathway protein G
LPTVKLHANVRSTRRGARPDDSGWTLIELLVVLSIILILAGLALTQYRNSVLHAKEAALRSDLYLMRDAIDQYYADKGKYPETIETLVTERYLRAVPRDPITGSNDTWQTEQAERESGAVASQAGIINVKSGSPDTALDGSRYGEW